MPWIAATVALAALWGALDPPRKTSRWRLAGGGLAALGAGAVISWLRGCAWGAEADANQALLGSAIAIIVGRAAVLGAAGVLRQRESAGQVGAGELRTGVFRLGWWWPWVLLSPTLAVLVLFLYYPAIQTFTLSTKLVRLGAPRSAEVCLANYTQLLTESPVLLVSLPLAAFAVMWGLSYWRRTSDPRSRSHGIAQALQPVGAFALIVALVLIFSPGNRGYRAIYTNTLIVSVGTVGLSMVIGLALAYLAFHRVRGVTVYRVLLIWPYAVSPPVAGILFFMMFDPTAGILKHLFELGGLPFPNYRQDAFLARMAVIGASVWKVLGYNILFYLAGLQTVPRDQIEAAALDGARAWQRFRSIVLPALGPITLFLIVTNLTYAFFDIYGTVDYLTKGAPAGATSVAIYEIIRVGIENRDIGRGAAQSVVLFIAVVALTAWQIRRSEGRISYGGAG